MKFSLSAAQRLTSYDLAPNGLEQLIASIGLQLGAVESVVEYGARYEGLLVVRVISVTPHPNADKLSVCLIDDGGQTKGVARSESGHVPVVCGAPNVRDGQSVVWIPPGVTVPSTYVESNPLVMAQKEIRGITSNGMIASLQELDLGNDSTGIHVINPDEVNDELCKPGTQFKRLYELDDTVIELENKMFTHRPDCFGILGVAREIIGIQGGAFTSPPWYRENVSQDQDHPDDNLPFSVKVDAPDLIPRFSALVVQDVRVQPSPMWLQAYLVKVGITPVNNIVDITNYVMHVTGQPMHAYDYDKIAQGSPGNPSLIARLASAGETITLLNSKTVELDQDTIVIASPEEIVGIGGVMGGANTEVDEKTNRIILESATFDMYSIRRSAMRYGLFTEAVNRFNKGQSPRQNLAALGYALEQILQIAGGIQASSVSDERGKNYRPDSSQITITADYVNSRLGSEIVANTMAEHLRNVEFAVSLSDNQLTVTPPFWRMDIAIAEDIIEEIGRLYGFQQLPVRLPVRLTQPATRNTYFEFAQRIRNTFAAAGVNELLTYTFINSTLIELSGINPDHCHWLRNALSPQLQVYRPSLLPSLLDKVHPNLKAGYADFSLFEINTAIDTITHDEVETGLPKEQQRLAFVVAAHDKLQLSSISGAGYFGALAYLQELARVLNFTFTLSPLSDSMQEPMYAPFEAARSATINNKDGTIIGIIGEFHSHITKGLKLPQYCAGFECSIGALLDSADKHMPYQQLSRFPGIDSDVTLSASGDLPHGTILQAVVQAISDKKYRSSCQSVDIFQKDLSSPKHHTFRIALSRADGTMTQAEANTVIDTMVKTVSQTLPVARI